MAGYIIGSQAYYEVAKKRLVEISKKLSSDKLTEDEKQKLYDEQNFLVVTIEDNYE